MNQLQMIRIDKTRENDTLPDKYLFVTHCREYTQKWLELSGILGARWTEEQFEKKMLGASGIFPNGIFYLLEDSKVIATATGVIGENRTGSLHMIAMADECRGKGLGNILCAKVVNYLLDRGMEKITLRTDDFRIPAIKIYLKLHFFPVLSDENMATRWKAVAKTIQCPVLPALDGDKYISNIL